MKKWALRIGIVLGALLVLFLLGLGAVYGISSSRLNERHQASAHPFEGAGGDPVEGRRLASLYGCSECHGEKLGGTLLIDGMPFARLAAPNLTAGRVSGALTADQWEVAVRHGIGPDGRALFIMPSPEYVYLSDQDLADVVAYARTLPPVLDDLPPPTLGPVGRALLTLGKLPPTTDLMPAQGRHLAAVAKEPTPEFGHYLTRLCTGCHGADLAGGVAGQPGSPPASRPDPERQPQELDARPVQAGAAQRPDPRGEAAGPRVHALDRHRQGERR